MYTSLALQAAVLGGFTYALFTVNESNNEYDAIICTIILDTYWVLSSFTIAFSLHVMLVATVLEVAGQGLALYGPIGSIVRATEGLNLEKNLLVFSFIGMIFFFAISTIFSCWVVMDFQSACINTFLSICGGYYWSYYCSSIYIRFYWDSSDFRFSNDDMNSSSDSNETKDSSDIMRKEIFSQFNRMFDFARLFAHKQNGIDIGIPPDHKEYCKRGFMSYLDISKKKSFIQSVPTVKMKWKRYFCTLHSDGSFNGLNVKDGTLFIKAIDLNYYFISVQDSLESLSSRSTRKKGAGYDKQENIFFIVLQIKSQTFVTATGKKIILRVDTLYEILEWLEAFRKYFQIIF